MEQTGALHKQMVDLGRSQSDTTVVLEQLAHQLAALSVPPT